MHRLHVLLTAEQVNEHLDAGAYAVVVHPRTGDRWDAVLDHPDDDVNASVVVEFLQSVDAAALEEIMLEGSTMGVGPGQAALRALVDLARRQG